MLLDQLQAIGAIQYGHFLLSSGLHSDMYVEKFRILEKPEMLLQMTEEIARKFQYMDVDYVVGPATGGIIVAHEVARLLNVEAIYVETQDSHKAVRRSKIIPLNKRFLVVDDVFTTGLSLLQTIEVISPSKPEWISTAVLVDRSQDVKFTHPLFACLKVKAQTYRNDEIPKWLQEIPVTKPGSNSTVPS